MSEIILFYVILLYSLFVHCEFDPSEIDYCKTKCVRPKSIASTACKCKKLQNRFDILSQPIQEFRKTVLEEHNNLRNKIASGEEKEKNKYPEAANMHALNYDMELEHVARCYVLNNFTKGHDKCRMTSFCAKGKLAGGQNLFGMSMKKEELKDVILSIQSWYDELTFIPENKRESIIDNFTMKLEWKADNFTGIIWAKQIRVGCARVWIPDNPNAEYKYTFVCNYAGPDEFCSSNVVGDKVYIKGPPCSKCGEGIMCNNETEGGKYNALCGEINSVPTDPLPKLEQGGDGKKKEKGGDGSDSGSSSSRIQSLKAKLVVFMVLVPVVEGLRGRWM